MKIGDLVKMDCDGVHPVDDQWGTGLILAIELDPYGGHSNVEVLWPKIGIGWEQSLMLEIVNESR